MKIAIGLVLLLVGMRLFATGVRPLAESPAFQFLGNPWVIFVVALAGTLVWQSSSITTAMLVGLVGGGALPLESGMVGVVAANIRH